MACWCALVAVAGALGEPAELRAQNRKIRLVVYGYNPQSGDTAMNRLCQELMREDPELVIAPWSRLMIEGPKGNSTKLLAYAGQTAPDVVFTHWHEIQTDIKHNFLCPINEYIGYDGFYGIDLKTNQRTSRTGQPKLRKDPVTGQMVPDTNGQIDDDEALWPEWRTYPLINRFVATTPGHLDTGPDGRPYDGPVAYGIPVGSPGYWGIVYRRDLFRKAGFKEGEHPKTWDEFWYYCQRLTDPKRQVPGAKFQRGQRGFALPLSGWLWLQWLWSTGGNFIMQAKTNPRTNKMYWFPKEQTVFIDPDTAEDLGRQPSRWKATFAGEPGKRSATYYHKLCWQRWVRNPKTGEPIDLTPEDLKVGSATDPRTGEEVTFTPHDVVTGAVRRMVAGEDSWVDMFRRGEVTMVMGHITGLRNYKVPPNNLGFFPVPGGPNGEQMCGYFRHSYALNSTLTGSENKRRRDKAWKVLSSMCGPRGRELTIRQTVLEGYARFMTPKELREARLDEYIDQIPKHWRDNYKKIYKNARAEPFMGYFYPVDAQLSRKVFGRLASKEKFDYIQGLIELENEANERIMFGLPEETKAKYRPWALLGVCVAAVLFALGIRFIVRAYREKELEVKAKELDRAASARGVHSRWLPWLLLGPALISIILWAYYPLGRGSVMAFQDYRIVGKSSWVGLDNFITIFYTKDFWVYLSKTFKYAAWSLGLCFFTPIILAILLSEVPKGKTFYRTVFFLPQVSSGLVVLFIWKLMYNPTEYGLLNQLLLGMNKLPIGLVIAMKLIVVSTVAALLYVVFRIALKQEHETRKSEVFFLVLAFGGVGLILMSLLADGGVLAWKDTYTGMFKRLGLLAIVGLGLYSAVWLGFKRTAETWQVRVCQAGVALGGMVLAGGLYAWATGLIADGASLVGVLEAMGRWIVWPFTGFGFTPQKWLNDVKWAMICVILPGMWASAGIGSLIYLAALKNVDEEIYEAAEIDGCGFFHKMWYITIPYLKPLIIINFVGAFIGTFRAMSNIFAMTGGGPGDETTVLSLAIWFEAFAFLKFGIATAMGWVLGLMLIGFTVYQLRILKKVEFRRAESF